METSDGFSKHTQALPDGSMLHVCNYQPSITSVLRSVKRLEHSNFNNIASLIHDASFVTHISASLPSLPLFANARCGLWYTPHYHAVSYFKSTDGHNNNWSFNLQRLNLHVAYRAAHSHGAIIVDATRRGKRFPDSMSKTIPIWAAVINMAIRELLNSNINNDTRNANITNKASLTELSSSSSSSFLHLPPWVSVNEKNQIAQRLNQWVVSLVDLCREDLLPLVDVLEKKPLKCFWISQPYDDRKEDGREEEAEEDATTAAAASTTLLSVIKDEGMKEDVFEHCTPLLLVSAALPNARMRRTLTLNRNDDDKEEENTSMDMPSPLASHPSSLSSSVLEVVYEYIPGAGDDEESWAQGLTPALMWKHKFQLLSVGAREGEEALRDTMLDIVANHGGETGNSRNTNTTTTPYVGSNSYQNIGNTGLYLGTTNISSMFDAILNVGSAITPSSSSSSSSAAAAAVVVEDNICGDVANNELPSCIHLFQSKNDDRRRMSAVQPYHYTVPSGEETKDTPFTTTGEDDKAKHYNLWLPIKSGKKDKHNLQAKLPAALQFISHHLEAGRTVLIRDDKTVGSDIAASIAIATLIACFDITAGGNAIKTDASSSLTVLPSSVDRQFKFKPVDIHPTTGCPLPSVNATAFDKLAVKKALATLAMYCPEIRPSQTSLKQVYNCFLP